LAFSFCRKFWNTKKRYIRAEIMERNWLICGMIGWFCAKEPNITSDDLRIKIDQFLAESKFTPLGTESGDLVLLDEMIGELTMASIGRGFNRDDRRK
jgi:hypothetical protein